MHFLIFFAAAAFFFAIAWIMLRFAQMATTKQDFLASFLCLVGIGTIGLIFCRWAWLSAGDCGCTQEETWTSTLVSGGFSALVAGHLTKCWGKPAFFGAILTVLLYGISMETRDSSALPKALHSFLYYAVLISWPITAAAWSSSLKGLKGNWFSIKAWNEFSQSKSE